MSSERPAEPIDESEAGENLPALIDRMREQGPVYIQRDGIRVAALIGSEELDRLMELAEDMEDLKAAEEARREWNTRGESPFHWDEI